MDLAWPAMPSAYLARSAASRLSDTDVHGQFDLLLDIGCGRRLVVYHLVRRA